MYRLRRRILYLHPCRPLQDILYYKKYPGNKDMMKLGNLAYIPIFGFTGSLVWDGMFSLGSCIMHGLQIMITILQLVYVFQCSVVWFSGS